MIFFIVFFPIIGAVLGYIIGRWKKEYRNLFAQLVTIIEFAVLLFQFVTKVIVNFGEQVEITNADWSGFCGLGLSFQLDGFRLVYGLIAAFMWMIATIVSEEYFKEHRNRNRYYLFLLITLGVTEGVFLSADLFTTFIFFEGMSFASYVWVAQEEDEKALRAAATYLAVAVIGGLVMLFGICLLYQMIGTLRFDKLYVSCRPILEQTSNLAEKNYLYVAGICLLFGFGAKAGAVPLHIWLPKAHPVAPAPASALLSGILTKAGMFGILFTSFQMFFENDLFGTIVLVIGVATMLTGAILALFSIDLKRVLACSSVSQVGFIMTGVGIQTLLGETGILAGRGAFLHMVNHSLIKLVLFLVAGVVFMNYHELDLNIIQGFGRKKPLLNGIFLMGVLGVGGIPLWNGYVSKTLIHEGILEYEQMLRIAEKTNKILGLGSIEIIEWLFLISGGMTIAYMLKLYIAVFIEKNNDEILQKKYDENKQYMSRKTAVALTISAAFLPIFGCFPNLIMGRLATIGQTILMPLSDKAELEQVSFFNLESLSGVGISIGIGIILYVVLIRGLLMRKAENGRREYVDRWPAFLDLENLIYRPLLLTVCPFILGITCRILDSLVDGIIIFLRKTVYKDAPIPHELDEGNMLTHILGETADCLRKARYRLLHKKLPEETIEHKLALHYDEWSEDSMIIGRSLSFGLLIFCIGLILTVIYLIWL